MPGPPIEMHGLFSLPNGFKGRVAAHWTLESKASGGPNSQTDLGQVVFSFSIVDTQNSKRRTSQQMQPHVGLSFPATHRPSFWTVRGEQIRKHPQRLKQVKPPAMH